MSDFLDKEHSIEEILPERDLENLARSYSKALNGTVGIFGKTGALLTLWQTGNKTTDKVLENRFGNTVHALVDSMDRAAEPQKTPALGPGGQVVPIQLDMALAGALAFLPEKPDESHTAAMELVRQSLNSLLYAHYKAALASQMQLAATEQSYEDLERQNTDLREAYDKLKTLDALKSDFVANVNHELRTPLTAILGFAEIMQLDNENLSGDQKECIDQIHEKAEHLVKLINRVLVFTDAGGERPRLSYSRFDLTGLIEEVFAQQRAAAEARKVELRLEPMAKPLGKIEADREKVAVVIDNLIENGIKFSPDGGTVRVMLEATEDPDVAGNAFLEMAKAGPTEVLIHVIDQGQGFSPQRAKEIFSDFHQLDSSSTREFGGLGLGLALARRVVELHGGKIMADSAPGEGSHFVVTLPIGPPPKLRTAPRRRILVVEDETFIVRLIGSYLSSQGYEVLTAAKASEVPGLVHGHALDLMLLDIRLPDRSGIDLLEDLRRDEMSHGLPVIVITALNDPALHERAQKAGAREILLKPFTRDTVLQAVDKVLKS